MCGVSVLWPGSIGLGWLCFSFAEAASACLSSLSAAGLPSGVWEHGYSCTMTAAALDVGCYDVVTDPAKNQWLVHSYTGQDFVLDSSTEFALVRDENGLPCLMDMDSDAGRDDADFQSCADMLTMKVYDCDNGGKFVVGVAGMTHPISGDAFQSLHNTWRTGLVSPGDAAPTMYVVHHFIKKTQGQAYWWTLETLVKTQMLPFLPGAKSRCGTVLDKRSKAWRRLAQVLQCPPLRRARQHDGREHTFVDGEPKRCLGKATVSTKLLVGIATSLAFRAPEQGGSFSSHAQAKAEQFLEALCRRSQVSDLILRIGCDCDMHDGSGKMLEQGLMLSFAVGPGLVVDARPLTSHLFLRRSRENRHIRKEAEFYIGRWGERGIPIDEVPLLELLNSMIQYDSHMLKDWISCIAGGVDAVLDAERQEWCEEMKMPDNAPVIHMDRAGGSDLDGHQMAWHNLQTLTAMAHRVAGVKNYSISTDAAKIGCKSRQNTLVVLPDNFASWGPPTVLFGAPNNK